MQKIAYLSSPWLADCDLPLLHELQQRADVTYLLFVTAKNSHVNLIDTEVKPQTGIFPATEYQGLQVVERMVDIRKTYVINMPGRHTYSPANLMIGLKLLRFLRKGGFDLLHFSFMPDYGTLPLYLLRRRMVLTVHDPLPHSDENGLLNRIHRSIAMRLIPNFVLLNQTQRDDFIRYYGIDSSRVHQSQLSVYTHLRNQTHPPLGPKGRLPEQEPLPKGGENQTIPPSPREGSGVGYVLFFGSINTHKGIEYLCQAMQQVHSQIPSARLIIAGKGNIYFDIQPYLDAGFLDLRNHYLTDPELAGLIRGASVVVCPYVDATQSGVVMSAFALCKPVIATNTGGLPEMVTDGRHGLLVPPRSADALANALLRLLTQPALLAQMSRNIEEDYSTGNRSWQHIADNLLNVYGKIR